MAIFAFDQFFHTTDRLLDGFKLVFVSSTGLPAKSVLLKTKYSVWWLYSYLLLKYKFQTDLD